MKFNKKYIPILLFIPTISLGAEQRLNFVGSFKCVDFKTHYLKSEYVLLQSKNNVFSQFSYQLKPIKLSQILNSIKNKYTLIQTYPGTCKVNNKVDIRLDKPIDALELLLEITRIYNFQYEIDGNLLYIPTYVEIYKRDISPQDLVKNLILKIKKFNPWLDIQISWDKKIFQIKGNVYTKNQLTAIYGEDYLSKLSAAPTKESSENASNKPLSACNIDTINYIDICKNSACTRYFLSIKKGIQLIPYNKCFPNENLKLRNFCSSKEKISTLYVDNINLVDLIQLFEKLFDIKFIYNKEALLQIKNSQNLHVAFNCLNKDKALDYLKKNFHLYLEKIGFNTYRIFTNKDDYSLVLQKVSNNITKILYLKGISPNDFVKYIELYYKDKVQYSIDPTFNAVVLIGPKKVIEDITKKFSIYIRNSNNFDNLMSKIFYVKYGNPKEIKEQIENYLSRRGSVKILGDVNAVEVIDYPTNISMIEHVFKGFLSQQPIAIKITVKFVQVQKNFLKSLGFNWFLGWSGISSGKSIVPTRYQYPEGIGGNTNTETTNTVYQNYLASFNNGALTISPVFVYKKLNPISLQLQAAEQVGLSKTLSSPYLVLLNGEEGSLTQGVQIPYQSVDQNGNPTTTFKTAALKLDITPKLLPDGKILLKLNLSKDSPSTNTPTSNAGPAINTFNIEQTFIVPNGEAVVIGGVLEKTSSTSSSGVPGLMRIPLLGWLFKTKNWNNQDNELIVIITAKVINQ